MPLGMSFQLFSLLGIEVVRQRVSYLRVVLSGRIVGYFVGQRLAYPTVTSIGHNGSS